MSIMSRNRALAGYLASTRSSEDPDLRRNDDDETHLDYDYNRVNMLGATVPGVSSLTSGGRQVMSSAQTQAVNVASSALNTGIQTATSMVKQKIDSVLGTSARKGSKYQIWEQQIRDALGITGIFHHTLIDPSTCLTGLSPLQGAPFFGDSPQFTSILGMAAVNVPFLKSINVVVPPAEMQSPSVATKLYRYAVYKALKDQNLLNAAEAGSLSQQQLTQIFNRFKNLDALRKFVTKGRSRTTEVFARRPNSLPNTIRFFFDGDSADKAMSELAKNVPGVDQILRNIGFYNAPLGQDAVDQIYAQIVGLLGRTNITVTIYNKNAPSGLRASRSTVNVNVLPMKADILPMKTNIFSPATTNITRFAQASAPVEDVIVYKEESAAEEPTEDAAKKKKSFFSSTAGMVTIGVGVLAIGGAAFYFMNKDKA